MGREEQIIEERIKKIEELRKQGINPYPYKFNQKNHAVELQEIHKSLKSEQKAKEKAQVAGRVMMVRDMGKISFVSIQDATGKIQLVLQEGETPEKVQEFFRKYVSSGDFIGASGPIFRTKRGELSIIVESIEILSKSIAPLPEKWHGLQDKEERYRKRYLDLIMSQEVMGIFHKREKILESIREFLKARSFHEVETPYLQTIYGGAAARPFETHLNALNIPLFLAISPELYLKRLIVGGYERVFTIARNFRNEGIDRWHNPEFTMMEIYQAYADYNDIMELTEDLFEYVAKKVNGTTKVTIKEKEIDFKKPWKRMTMAEAIKKWANIDVLKMSESELKDFVEENRVECNIKSWGLMVQAIFEHFCEEKIEQPTFITDHPLETTPLCKIHRTDKRLIERFEPFCMGTELANAYSELNDPVLQRQLLEEQQKMLSQGNAEANPYDEDFVNAIEIGMPPTGGLGIGIDRMVILLTGSESIKDVIAFPFMKPEVKDEKKEEVKEGKSKETRQAVVLINKSSGLLPWEELNTVAHLNAAFGARLGRNLFYQDSIKTKDNEDIKLNIQHAIIIKDINSNSEILKLARKAKEEGLEVSEFTREMISTTNDKKVIEMTQEKNVKDVEYLGVLIFGKKSRVDELTKDYPFYKGNVTEKKIFPEKQNSHKKQKKK